MTHTEERTRPVIDPRILSRRIAVRRDEGRHRLRVIVGVAVVLVLVAAGWVATRTPLLDVDHIRVTGARRTSPAAIQSASGIDRGDPMTEVDEGDAARRVARLPWVRDAHVSRHWPGSVHVRVTERVPAAVARARGGGWMLVDDTGRLLQHVPLPPENLEAIEGTPLAGGAGGRLAPSARRALRVAAAIPLSRVAQIRVTALLDDGTIELRLVPSGVVRFGAPTQIHDKLVAVLTVLEQADLRRVAVIDVQVPSAPVLTRA